MLFGLIKHCPILPFCTDMRINVFSGGDEPGLIDRSVPAGVGDVEFQTAVLMCVCSRRCPANGLFIVPKRSSRFRGEVKQEEWV